MATRIPLAPTPAPVIRSWGLTGWYAMVFCTVFAYSVLPIFGAVLANKANWPTVTLAIALITAIVDGALLWHPATWLLTTVVDFYRRLRGLKPLADMTEEERQSVTERMYVRLVTYAYIKAAVLLFLVFIPIKGNEGLATIATVLGVLVILGAPVFASKHPWIGRFLYNRAWVVLLLALIAMAFLAFNPELRPAARVQGAEQELRGQVEEQRAVWLNKEVSRINGLMSVMGQKEPWLTQEQRVDKLSVRDREIWNEGTRGWVKAQVANTRERLFPSLKETWLAVIGQGDPETVSAHKAIEKIRADHEKAILNRDLGEALKCYTDLNGLGRNPTPTEWERCEAMRRNVGRSVTPVTPTPPAVTAAGQVNGEEGQVPDPAPAAIPAPTTHVETAWQCDTVVKEVEYSPGHQYGPVAIDTFPAGRYEISVAGKRQQPFYTGIPAVLDKMCEMDADGNIGVCRNALGQPVSDLGGQNWPAPAPALVPSNEHMNFPYGMFVIRAWGKVLPIGSEGQINSDRPIHIEFDVNNFQHPLNYGGQGSLWVQIRRCV